MDTTAATAESAETPLAAASATNGEVLVKTSDISCNSAIGGKGGAGGDGEDVSGDGGEGGDGGRALGGGIAARGNVTID